MQDDWIGSVVGGILGRSQRRHQEQQIRLLNADLIRQKGTASWLEFAAAVGHDVGRFNKQIGNDADLKLEYREDPPNRFVVSRKRPLFPNVKVECVLSLIDERIEIVHSKVLENFAPPAETRSKFSFSVADDGSFSILYNEDLSWISTLALIPLTNR